MSYSCRTILFQSPQTRINTERFKAQEELLAQGDEEANTTDEDFLNALARISPFLCLSSNSIPRSLAIAFASSVVLISSKSTSAYFETGESGVYRAFRVLHEWLGDGECVL